MADGCLCGCEDPKPDVVLDRLRRGRDRARGRRSKDGSTSRLVAVDGDLRVLLTIGEASVLKSAAQLALALLDNPRVGPHTHGASEPCAIRDAIGALRTAFEQLIGDGQHE